VIHVQRATNILANDSVSNIYKYYAALKLRSERL